MKNNKDMLQKWKDGDLKYMWQLNLHNDLRNPLKTVKII